MTNTDIVLTAMRELFEDKDLSALDRYWAEPYIQHNPTAPNGLAGVRAVVPTLEGFRWTPSRVVEQGDLVMTLGRLEGVGPGPMIIAEVFRLENGRIVEHWDVV